MISLHVVRRRATRIIDHGDDPGTISSRLVGPVGARNTARPLSIRKHVCFMETGAVLFPTCFRCRASRRPPCREMVRAVVRRERPVRTERIRARARQAVGGATSLTFSALNPTFRNAKCDRTVTCGLTMPAVAGDGPSSRDAHGKEPPCHASRPA